MRLHRTTYYLYRECLPTAPLPESHRALILRDLSALQQQRPQAKYSIIEYTPAEREVVFTSYDFDQPWPERQGGVVTVERQRKCAGSPYKTAVSLSFSIGLPFDTNPLRRPRPKIFTTSSEIL